MEYVKGSGPQIERCYYRPTIIGLKYVNMCCPLSLDNGTDMT
jgi:hypothetical protein